METSIQKKDWSLTESALRQLLDWLDEGKDSGGERYLEMRRRLVSYFDRKNCLSPDDTAKELERLREQLARLEASQQTVKPEPPERAANITSFDLLPQTRGVSQLATITVPNGTDYIALRLQLEPTDFPLYEAALKNPATNQIMWRSGRLKARPEGKLSISLPASLLKPQNYTLEVTGKAQGGAAEFIGGYTFRVVIH